MALAALLFAPTLGMFFASDDITFLLRAAGLAHGSTGGLRVLSGPVAWGSLYHLFGLQPAPYNAVRLVLHLIATGLVYGIGEKLLANKPAAGAAAVMFGVSTVAFTPLHWGSGIIELLMATFVLGALRLALAARGSRAGLLHWMGATCVALAMISKETALLIVIPIFAAIWNPGSRASRREVLIGLKVLWPYLLVTVGFGAIAVFLSLSGRHLGGAAYRTSFAPGHLLDNLLTYLRWGFSLRDPVPDRVAASSYHSLATQSVAVMAAAMLVIALRHRWRPAEIVGGLWFITLLAPVLPLTAHSYLYYLYVPWAGACWCVSSVGSRVFARLPGRWTGVALGAMLSAYVAVVFHNVHVRETARVNGLPVDRTMRESLLLRNCLRGLEKAGIAAPDSICFVNPLPKLHQDLTSLDASLHAEPAGSASYAPLVGALRDGESLALFLPGVRVLGFGETIPERWGAASAFFYADDGELTALGRGAEAQRRIGGLMLKVQRWELAAPTFLRAIAMGDTTADTAYALLYSLAGLGQTEESTRLVVAFIKHWPQDPRTRILETALSEGAK